MQAAIIWIACQWSGVAITTASMSLRSSTARKSLTRATSPSIVRHLGDPLAQPGEPRIDPVVGAVQIRLVDVAQGDDLGVGMRQEALQELAAAIADADEAEPDPVVGPQHAARAGARGRRGTVAAADGGLRERTTVDTLRHGGASFGMRVRGACRLRP